MGAMNAIEEYVAGLGLDAISSMAQCATGCSTARRRIPDFLVGVDIRAPQRAPRVAGRGSSSRAAVGLRLFPRDRARTRRLRASARAAGNSRQAGPHDFEIAVDAFAGVEEDLERRDFTINAMARRLADGAAHRPYNGRDDLDGAAAPSRAELRHPLRIVRGLRTSAARLRSQPATLAQMQDGVGRLVSAERSAAAWQPTRAVEAAPRR
jgi:hypothetical protein